MFQTCHNSSMISSNFLAYEPHIFYLLAAVRFSVCIMCWSCRCNVLSFAVGDDALLWLDDGSADAMLVSCEDALLCISWFNKGNGCLFMLLNINIQN